VAASPRRELNFLLQATAFQRDFDFPMILDGIHPSPTNYLPLTGTSRKREATLLRRELNFLLQATAFQRDSDSLMSLDSIHPNPAGCPN